MKILIICQKLASDDDLLGAFVAWVRAIAKHADHVDVVCLGVGEYKLPDNVKVYSLGKERGAPQRAGQVGRVGRWFNFVRLMFKLMPECDVTFSHMCPIFCLASWPFVRLYGKKATLWYAHGTVSGKLRLAEKCVDVIFTSTVEGCRIVSDKIKVVGQGVDVEKFGIERRKDPSTRLLRPSSGQVGAGKRERERERRDGRFRMVSVGRIAPSKDYETMIRTVDVLVRDGVRDFEVKVIGKANLEEHEKYFDKIKKMVEELGLDDYIKFVGAVPNNEVVRYFQEADLYLNMSWTGSLDRAIVEAMACGCLVLTCNEAARGPLSNIGLENLMYGKGDCEMLAEKIVEVKRKDPSTRLLRCDSGQVGTGKGEREDVGRRLRQEVVERHSVERLGEKIVEIISNF